MRDDVHVARLAYRKARASHHGARSERDRLAVGIVKQQRRPTTEESTQLRDLSTQVEELVRVERTALKELRRTERTI